MRRALYRCAMANTDPQDGLLKAYRHQIDWLVEKARQCDETRPDEAAEFLHQARNLQAVLAAYERLKGKRTS